MNASPVRVWFESPPHGAAISDAVALDGGNGLCFVCFASGNTFWVAAAAVEPSPTWPAWARDLRPNAFASALEQRHVFRIRALVAGDWVVAHLLGTDGQACLVQPVLAGSNAFSVPLYCVEGGLDGGRAAVARYQAFQALLASRIAPPPPSYPQVAPPMSGPQPYVIERIERIIERQVIVTHCRFCSELTPVDLSACKVCGGKLR